MTVNRIGLVVHGGREEAADAKDRVSTWCADHDVSKIAELTGGMQLE